VRCGCAVVVYASYPGPKKFSYASYHIYTEDLRNLDTNTNTRTRDATASSTYRL
jgi:hypothetical protein